MRSSVSFRSEVEFDTLEWRLTIHHLTGWREGPSKRLSDHSNIRQAAPGRSLEECLGYFLLQYWVTPHTSTGEMLCELLMVRGLATKLDTLFLDVRERVTVQQERQARYHDKGAEMSAFAAGEGVNIRDFSRTNARWVAGVVL